MTSFNYWMIQHSGREYIRQNYLSINQSINQPIYLSIYLSVYLSIRISIYLSTYLPINQSIYLSIICPSIFLAYSYDRSVLPHASCFSEFWILFVHCYMFHIRVFWMNIVFRRLPTQDNTNTRPYRSQIQAYNRSVRGTAIGSTRRLNRKC